MAQSHPSSAERWLASISATPEFTAPASQKAWGKRRQEIRTQLWDLLGQLPPRPKKLAVRTLTREEREGYFLETFRFDNGAGAEVPGYLLLPKNAPAKSPALLYCHWHGGQYEIGKEELFLTNAAPERPGPSLVRRGFVVLGVDAYCFGQRNGQGPGGPAETGSAGEMTASKFNLWAGRSLWGMIVRDDLIALDYLCSRPEVEASRIGVTGISMGATRTWWVMALDDRPRTGVAVGCLTRYQNLIQREGLKYHGIYYFVPAMLQHFDTEAVVALAAPRPMLFMTGDQDFGSPVDGLRLIESKVRPIYQLFGKGQEFENVIYPGVGHVYLPGMWQRTLDWMEKHLKAP